MSEVACPAVSSVQAPKVPARVRILILGQEQRVAVECHLLALGERDRYLRFGYQASDEQIQRYVGRLDFGRDELFGSFDDELELVALAHLGYLFTPGRQHLAEFGVSVSPSRRGCGHGQQLFERAVVHARNQGVSRLIVYALSENAAMIRIARKAGAEVRREGSESEATLQLPPADFGSLFSELVAEQVARTDYHVKSAVRQVSQVLDLVHEIREGVREAKRRA